jgi:hypothetical protein
MVIHMISMGETTAPWFPCCPNRGFLWHEVDEAWILSPAYWTGQDPPSWALLSVAWLWDVLPYLHCRLPWLIN